MRWWRPAIFGYALLGLDAEGSKSRTDYDLAWRLQGLVSGGQSREPMLQAPLALLAVQHSDGGWSDLPSMESGAFSTSVAVRVPQSSGLRVSDAAYQGGVRYLPSTQQPDGSWHVRMRAAGFPPYFDNGFPHGVDQRNPKHDEAAVAALISASHMAIRRPPRLGPKRANSSRVNPQASSANSNRSSAATLSRSSFRDSER